MSNRPENIQGYEDLAETEALFDEGDRIIHDPAPGLIPARIGNIRWRRWELGNRCWGYALDFDEGPGTISIESYLKVPTALDLIVEALD